MTRVRRYLASNAIVPWIKVRSPPCDCRDHCRFTDRAGALVAFCEHQEHLSAVTNLLVDGGLCGAALCRCRAQPSGDHGNGCQAKRAAHLCRALQTLGCRTLVCLVGKMSKVMEKLRAKAQYQLTICHLSFSGPVAPNIVNRLLVIHCDGRTGKPCELKNTPRATRP